MKINILKNNAILNAPAKSGDAGFDLFAVNPPRVIGSIYQGLYYSAISHIEYDTELRVEPESKNDQYEFYNLLYPRSSIINTNLMLANSVGVIDSGYRGNIKVCFKYIIQPEDMKIIEGKSIRGKQAKGIVSSINPQRIYQQGDKIAQLIPCKHNHLLINYVDELGKTERGTGGFGSTGL
jgi:dUTP pyrophosphatase